MDGRMAGEGGGACRAGVDGVSISELHLVCTCRKPLPVDAHGTQCYKAAARHTHVAYDVGG